jgi:hypothetical protein
MARGKKTGGRQKGTPNKLTAAITAVAVAGAEKSALAGPSMLDILEGNARYFLKQAEEAEDTLATLRPDADLDPQDQFNLILAEVKKAAGLRALAGDAAKNAAPYRHPRLAAIEHTGKDGGPIETRVIVVPAKERRG